MMPVDALTSMSTSLGSLPHVWAYLDPGAGSVVLQILFAGMLSTLFFLKSWVRQFRESLLIRNKKA